MPSIYAKQGWVSAAAPADPDIANPLKITPALASRTLARMPIYEAGDHIDVGSTGKVAELECDYEDIVAAFGEPGEGDAWKVSAEWRILFADGTRATIHDYKTGIPYLGEEDLGEEDGLEPEDTVLWSVGGDSVRAAELVARVLGKTCHPI